MALDYGANVSRPQRSWLNIEQKQVADMINTKIFGINGKELFRRLASF
jgi:hypothetical protein